MLVDILVQRCVLSRTVSLGNCFFLIFQVNIVSALGTFSFGCRYVSDDRIVGGCP